MLPQSPFLVIGLGRIEPCLENDWSAYRSPEFGAQCISAPARFGELLLVAAEQRSAVLRSLREQGVVTLPKERKQVSEPDLLRVEVESERFGVVADVPIRGVWSRTACVANLGAVDAIETPEPGVGSPKSPERECESRERCGKVEVDRWGGHYSFSSKTSEAELMQ